MAAIAPAGVSGLARGAAAESCGTAAIASADASDLARQAAAIRL
ncbi:unnamed protein product [Gongylonema pulchrum]|uniref:PE family protein n=1 Tax=Gongylonema pulchrum TaxID=637853 RepID=A0A183DL08_9BILA|nr:unnamed protein product [Gongylonema pulchrum]